LEIVFDTSILDDIKGTIFFKTKEKKDRINGLAFQKSNMGIDISQSFSRSDHDGQKGFAKVC
jgi:hypothetical protein